MENILVSVRTLTYNQEKYIKQTVESLISQETDFDYEVVISDDGSTDRTVAIVEEIIKNHPQGKRIRFSCTRKPRGFVKLHLYIQAT